MNNLYSRLPPLFRPRRTPDGTLPDFVGEVLPARADPADPGPPAPSDPSGPVSAPDGLGDRVAAFRQQLDEWTASGRFGAPLLGLPGVEVRAGACISCGEPLTKGQTWRCPLCVRAVEVVLGLDPAP